MKNQKSATILANENGQCLKISENAAKKLLINEALANMAKQRK
jgi:hypothetical protein